MIPIAVIVIIPGHLFRLFHVGTLTDDYFVGDELTIGPGIITADCKRPLRQTSWGGARQSKVP